ncbi:hypothetical protein Tco_0820760, partial [Tanacetum coccineum]
AFDNRLPIAAPDDPAICVQPSLPVSWRDLRLIAKAGGILARPEPYRASDPLLESFVEGYAGSVAVGVIALSATAFLLQTRPGPLAGNDNEDPSNQITKPTITITRTLHITRYLQSTLATRYHNVLLPGAVK